MIPLYSRDIACSIYACMDLHAGPWRHWRTHIRYRNWLVRKRRLRFRFGGRRPGPGRLRIRVCRIGHGLRCGRLASMQARSTARPPPAAPAISGYDRVSHVPPFFAARLRTPRDGKYARQASCIGFFEYISNCRNAYPLTTVSRARSSGAARAGPPRNAAAKSTTIAASMPRDETDDLPPIALPGMRAGGSVAVNVRAGGLS